MWSPTLMITLLGAALTAAAPFTANTTHGTIDPQGCEVYSHIFPDGLAPVHMALVEDPSAEWARCKFKAFKTCLKLKKNHSDLGCFKELGKLCKIKEVIAPVVAKVILPAEEKNKTLPICGDNLLDYVSQERQERKETAPGALEPRQKDKCPKHCAVWAVLPPFGVWFAACMADCALRCARGQSCP